MAETLAPVDDPHVYLQRAKELRALAAEVRDHQAREALNEAASCYERMACARPDETLPFNS